MIFIVIAGVGHEVALKERILDQYGKGKSIQLHPKREGEWLVSSKETAVDVADRLGITADKPDDILGIVAAISGYWGREPPNIWEWITTNGND